MLLSQVLSLRLLSGRIALDRGEQSRWRQAIDASPEVNQQLGGSTAEAGSGLK